MQACLKPDRDYTGASPIKRSAALGMFSVITSTDQLNGWSVYRRSDAQQRT